MSFFNEVLAQYTARQIVEWIANDYTELSHEKVKLQRDDHQRICRTWLDYNRTSWELEDHMQEALDCLTEGRKADAVVVLENALKGKPNEL